MVDSLTLKQVKYPLKRQSSDLRQKEMHNSSAINTFFIPVTASNMAQTKQNYTRTSSTKLSYTFNNFIFLILAYNKI